MLRALLPVLALSACWLGRQYTPAEVLAAFLMVLSAVLFGLGERELEPSFHPLGIALSFCCLGAQAFQSNLQDTLLRDRGVDVHEAMLWSNAAGFVFVLCITIGNGELLGALAFFAASRMALWLLLLQLAAGNWLLLCCWLLIAAAGCCWLQLSAGRCWLRLRPLLVAAAAVGDNTEHRLAAPNRQFKHCVGTAN